KVGTRDGIPDPEASAKPGAGRGPISPREWAVFAKKRLFRLSTVSRVLFSANGKTLAADGGPLGGVREWDVEGKAAVALEPPGTKTHRGPGDLLAVSPSGALVVTVSGSFRLGREGDLGCDLRVWDARTGACRREATLPLHERNGPRFAAFSPDGKSLVV